MGSPCVVGLATRTTCCSAANDPVQVLSPKIGGCPQSRVLAGGDSTSTVPSPLMPTSSRSGVKMAAIQSPSSSTVNVQGPVPSHADRLQWTKLDGGAGWAVALTVTLDPLSRV